MLPSFIENPTNISFEGQDADEKIIFLVRAHPITNLTWIIPALITFFIPFLLPDLISLLRLDFILTMPQSYLNVIIILDYLLVLAIIFEGFLGWYFNVNILTNKNIIDVDFHSLLSRDINILPLINLEEASSSIAGVFASIFRYGNVLIQTAGEREDAPIKNIPNPDRVADLIMDQARVQREVEGE
jgi:hypothetical protein